MLDHFDRFYAAVNAEWPVFNQTEEEAAQQARRWRFAFQSFSPEALGHALTKALRTFKKRPKAADLLELAQEGAPKVWSRPERPLPHWTRCECGCGGLLWYLVLRDPITKAARHYPPTVEEMTAKLGAALRKLPVTAAQMHDLCGEPMTRTKCECKKHGGDPLPSDTFYLGLHADGVPVYDLGRAS